ncbi:hypothetical protein [Sporohalobacter salinus]|nr:hypothetical protein [Sporohalobacter salinus]MBM7624885.1 hypothetical protein [Sporohalobacter salinus]
MEIKEVEFAELNDSQVQKLNKMEETLADRKDRKIILLACEQK